MLPAQPKASQTKPIIISFLIPSLGQARRKCRRPGGYERAVSNSLTGRPDKGRTYTSRCNGAAGTPHTPSNPTQVVFGPRGAPLAIRALLEPMFEFVTDVAQYRLSVKVISRGVGRNAAAAAAYRGR